MCGHSNCFSIASSSKSEINQNIYNNKPQNPMPIKTSKNETSLIWQPPQKLSQNYASTCENCAKFYIVVTNVTNTLAGH